MVAQDALVYGMMLLKWEQSPSNSFKYIQIIISNHQISSNPSQTKAEDPQLNQIPSSPRLPLTMVKCRSSTARNSLWRFACRFAARPTWCLIALPTILKEDKKLETKSLYRNWKCLTRSKQKIYQHRDPKNSMGKGSSIFGNVLQADSKYTYSFTKKIWARKNVESNKLNRKKHLYRNQC